MEHAASRRELHHDRLLCANLNLQQGAGRLAGLVPGRLQVTPGITCIAPFSRTTSSSVSQHETRLAGEQRQ
jgi:hypothetical protein